MALTNLLAQRLDEAATFLEKSGSSSATSWADNLRRLRSELTNGARVNQALAELQTNFGGMGSLNDYVFCELNENLPAGWNVEQTNKEFRNILEECYKELQVLRSNSFAKAWWLGLEWWRKK